MNMPTRPALDLPIIAIDLPVFYEDEGQEEMGETEWHALVMDIAAYALRQHLRATGATTYRVYTDMCLYYHPLDRAAYVSPDVMVCVPTEEPPVLGLRSYRIGRHGPAPLLVVEVLSRRSNQQQDLTEKSELYGRMGVEEYLLLDPTGDFMPEQLRLLQYDVDGTWVTRHDQGQGVQSRHGFRVVLEPSGLPRFYGSDGLPIRFPSEAEPEIEAMNERLEAAEREREAAEKRQAKAEKRQVKAEERQVKAEESQAEAERQMEEERKRAEAAVRDADDLRRLVEELRRQIPGESP